MGTESAWHQRWGRPQGIVCRDLLYDVTQGGQCPQLGCGHRSFPWCWGGEVGEQGAGAEKPIESGVWRSVPGRELTGSRCRKKLLTKSQNSQGLWLKSSSRPYSLKGVRLPMQGWGSSHLLEREARKAERTPCSRSFISKQTCRGKPATFQRQSPFLAYSNLLQHRDFSCPQKFTCLPPLNSCLHQAKFTPNTPNTRLGSSSESIRHKSGFASKAPPVTWIGNFRTRKERAGKWRLHLITSWHNIRNFKSSLKPGTKKT